MTKIQTLPEILDSTGIVLVDGSLRTRGPAGESLAREIYDSGYYSQINPHRVQEEIESIEAMINLFQDERTLTLPEVAEEIKKYPEIIGNKLSSIGQTPKKRGKRKNGKTGKIRRSREIRRKSEDSLRTLQNKLWDFYNLAKAKSVNITLPHYEPLVNMIKILDKGIGLKKNTGYLYGSSETKKEENPNDTDERMISASYCFSISRDKPFCVITSDSDLVNLWGISSRLLGSDDLLPHNEWFRKAGAKDLFRLYTQDRDNGDLFNLPSKGMNVDYSPTFKIYGLNYRDNEEVKEQIVGLMKKVIESEKAQN